MYSVKLFDKTSIEANKTIKDSDIPKLIFKYGEPFDWTSEPPVPQEMIDELTKKPKQRINEFQALWEESGKPLVGSALKLLGKKFSIDTIETVLILHATFPPMSIPFLIPVRRQMDCLPADELRRTRQFFIHNVLHVLLLRYIDENFPELDNRSLLRNKYAAEPEMTKNFLFPFAIIRTVYQSNGRGDELDKIIAHEISDPRIKKALEIVKNEGAKPFLEELSNYETLVPQQITPP